MIVVTTGVQPFVQNQISPSIRLPGRPRLTATWTSWTGDSWTITDPKSPVFALVGATGMSGTDPEHWWSTAPSIDGSSWDGLRVPQGEIFMPIRLDGSTADEFLATRDAFRKSLNPRQTSTLRLTRPDGTWREIACRYVSGKDQPIEPDPLMVRRETLPITWATADPYWSGAPVSVPFPYSTPLPLFPGPTFHINSSRQLGNTSVTNLGDADSYAVWKISPPYTGFTVGVGSSVVTMALGHVATGSITIDARPGQLTMLDGAGNDVWHYATEEDLMGMAIPADGQPVPLTTTLVGAGSGSQVSVTFTPRYEGGW